jgi:hypothetical protein
MLITLDDAGAVDRDASFIMQILEHFHPLVGTLHVGEYDDDEFVHEISPSATAAPLEIRLLQQLIFCGPLILPLSGRERINAGA